MESDGRVLLINYPTRQHHYSPNQSIHLIHELRHPILLEKCRPQLWPTIIKLHQTIFRDRMKWSCDVSLANQVSWFLCMFTNLTTNSPQLHLQMISRSLEFSDLKVTHL
jgi:hypothetical protein